MKKKFNILVQIVVYIIALHEQVVIAQPASSDIVVKKFDDYRKKTLQEKIYVHLDQNFYLTGETLWFKVYNVDGSLHKTLDVSKVAYIELLDKKNVAVLQFKVSLAEGLGAGSIFLPATLQSGNYLFRCYTNWMKNFSAEFYFHKTITIVNPFVIPETEKLKNNPPVQIDFFPEGGYLVNDLTSKIGFKIKASGDENKYTGAILNSNNDTIVAFTPGKFGLGNFNFTPTNGQAYKAIIKSENGNTSTHTFPVIKEHGYVMSLSKVGNKLKVDVSGRFNQQDKNEFIYLFIHGRNIIFKSEIKPFHLRHCEFTFDFDKLPEGISHFTILDENQKPVCERLFFKQPVKPLNISASTGLNEYGKRRKVTLRIQTNFDKHSLPGNLSVAVHKIDSLSNTDSQNIHHYLWLTSDLKGPIESPEYYFNTQDTTVWNVADNLMLTHGWRRFKWDNIFSDKITITNIPEYRGHIVKGKVTSKNDSAATGTLSYLSVKGKIVRLYAARSNDKGEVQFEVNELQGQHKLVLQTSPSELSSVKLKIESPFSTEFGSAPIKPFQLPSSKRNKFLERSVAMQVQDIYYEDQQSGSVSQPTVDSAAFFGLADETYYLDRYTRFPVMEEVMREYVPGVFVRKRKDGFSFVVVDINQGVLEGDPMILLDGVPLFDADKIMAADPLKVKKLEVVKRKYYLGPLHLPGIVSFTSYQGDIAGLELDPGTVTLNYEGLQIQREFYSPTYETQTQLNSRVPDRRFLLYWNPAAATNNEGFSELEFYTSDITGQFQITIEGITREGQAGSTSSIFTVK